MLAELLLRFIEFAVRTVVLFGLLWVMTKLQRFKRKYEYHSSKLVGVAALASALDMVPYAGHFLAVPVLWVGVKKVTRADYFETLWTIAVAYGLVFGGNRLLPGPFMKNLQAHKNNPIELIGHPRWLKKPGTSTAVATNLQAVETNLPVGQTNAPVSRLAATNPPTPGIRPVSRVISATNLLSQTTNQIPPNATNAAPPPAPAVKSAPNLTKYISVRGVTRNGANSAASIQSGAKVYTVFLEEATLMQTPDGPVSVRFAELGTNSLTLEINGVPVNYPIR